MYDEDMDISAAPSSSIKRTESLKDIEMSEQMSLDIDEDAAVGAMPVVAEKADQDDQDDDDEMDYSSLKNTIYDQTQVIESIFRIFDSKEFCDKIESSLGELVEKQQTASPVSAASPNGGPNSDRDMDPLNEFCLSVSQICNFILVKSQSKIHQSL